MILEGTVTNVAAFGAFVDVGVHQDGLVHVSALANRFVSDPREVVKSGQVVRVKVLEADPERKRISLTLRLDDEPAPVGGRTAAAGARPAGSGARPAASGRQGSGASRQAPAAPRQGSEGRQAGSDGNQPRNGRSEAKRTPPPQPAPVNTAKAEALRKAGQGK
jgi:uncharacterized protein